MLGAWVARSLLAPQDPRLTTRLCQKVNLFVVKKKSQGSLRGRRGRPGSGWEKENMEKGWRLETFRWG